LTDDADEVKNWDVGVLGKRFKGSTYVVN